MTISTIYYSIGKLISKKYRELLLEAAETVLEYFGFDRTAFGDPPKKRMKWWQRFNEEKLRDRDTETT